MANRRVRTGFASARPGRGREGLIDPGGVAGRVFQHDAEVVGRVRGKFAEGGGDIEIGSPAGGIEGRRALAVSGARTVLKAVSGFRIARIDRRPHGGFAEVRRGGLADDYRGNRMRLFESLDLNSAVGSVVAVVIALVEDHVEMVGRVGGDRQARDRVVFRRAGKGRARQCGVSRVEELNYRHERRRARFIDVVLVAGNGNGVIEGADGDGGDAFVGADRPQRRFVFAGGAVAQRVGGSLRFGDVAGGVDHVDVASGVDGEVDRAGEGAGGAGSRRPVERPVAAAVGFEASDPLVGGVGDQEVVRGRVNCDGNVEVTDLTGVLAFDGRDEGGVDREARRRRLVGGVFDDPLVAGVGDVDVGLPGVLVDCDPPGGGELPAPELGQVVGVAGAVRLEDLDAVVGGVDDEEVAGRLLNGGAAGDAQLAVAGAGARAGEGAGRDVLGGGHAREGLKGEQRKNGNQCLRMASQEFSLSREPPRWPPPRPPFGLGCPFIPARRPGRRVC